MSPMPRITLRPSVPLADDVYCARCGYNLRGLMPSGRCPECGLAIDRSVGGNKLRFADADWVAKLHRGTEMLLWGMLLGLVAGVAGPVVSGALLVPVMMSGVLGSVFLLWGVLLVTTQEPMIANAEDSSTLRTVVRGAAITGSVLTITACVGQVVDAGAWLGPVGLAIADVCVVGFFAKLLYFFYLALRIPDVSLAASTKTITWGFAIALGLPTLGAATSAWVNFTATGRFSLTWQEALGTMGCFGCVDVLALLILGLWWVRLLFAYGETFKIAATEARRLPRERDEGVD